MGYYLGDTWVEDQTAGLGSVPTPKGYNSNYVRWSGDAGAPVEYLSGGKWVSGGAPEHGESASYLQKAFADPQTERLFKFAAENPNKLNNEQRAFMSNPMLGLDSLGQGGRWGALNLFDDKFDPQQAGALLQTGGGGYLSDADKEAGATFNFRESPAEQSKRAEADDGFLGLGDLGTLALLAAGGYGLGALGGLWGGAASAGGIGAAELAAADSMAGLIPSSELAAWTGAGAGGVGASEYANVLGDWPVPGLTPQLGLEGARTMSVAEMLGATPTSGMNAGLPGMLDAGGALTGTGAMSPATLSQMIGQATGALTSTGAAAGELIPGINAIYDFAAGSYVPAVADAAGNLVAATSLAAPFTEPNFFEKLLQSFSDNKSTASSIGKLLGLGDTATGGLNLLSKLLTGIGAAKANRESLATNADRLREAKDTTPLAGSQFNMLRPTALRRAKGGLAQCAECGGGSSTPRYVQGGTSGQSDKIPALLSDGEYVFDADAVSALGDGNNAAGAAALDQMRQNIRKHKRSAPPTKIPPKAKKPEQYMKGAK